MFEQNLSVLLTLKESMVTFVPSLIGALLLLIIGYALGKIVGAVIERMCIGMKINTYLKCKGFKLSKLFKIAGEWWIYLVFIQSAVGTLGILSLELFINGIVNFIPMAVGAAIIVVVGYILGSFFEDQISNSEGKYNRLVGKIVNFFTVYVSIALALPVLGVNPSLVNNILLVIIASVGLGFALATGLGLKETVAKEAGSYVSAAEKAVKKKR
ncbi:MAG: hypothetical protein KAT28_00110 [Candidatus Aenigmarchaeota archaeon]|nr:hypothetical protein [Candidatus Aenigmarchaeota archaeon]